MRQGLYRRRCDWNRTPKPCRKGLYLTVYLHNTKPTGKNRKHTNKLIHVLVLEAFVGPRPKGAFACHYDGDPTNNRLSNLRWDTWASNIADMRRHGTLAAGADKPQAKLTDEDVIAIRCLRRRGVQISRIADVFGVSGTTVSKIAAGKKWKHLLSEWRNTPPSDEPTAGQS